MIADSSHTESGTSSDETSLSSPLLDAELFSEEVASDNVWQARMDQLGSPFLHDFEMTTEPEIVDVAEMWDEELNDSEQDMQQLFSRDTITAFLAAQSKIPIVQEFEANDPYAAETEMSDEDELFTSENYSLEEAVDQAGELVYEAATENQQDEYREKYNLEFIQEEDFEFSVVDNTLEAHHFEEEEAFDADIANH